MRVASITLATVFFLLCCATVGAGAQVPAATQPADHSEQERLSLRKQAERDAAMLPAVELSTLQDLVRFTIEGDALTARTSVSRPDQDVRVIAPGLRGLAKLRVISFGGAGADPAERDDVGRNFNLIVEDLTQPALGHSITHVSGISGRLIVARDAETSTVMSSVQLIQETQAMADPSGVEPPVRLHVKISDATSDQPTVDLKLTASSFSELRRKHPPELNRYLRPILRDFGQEAAVFGTDERAQWQVLAADVQPDEAIVAKTRAALAKFDLDDFQERERAAAELQALGQPAAIALTRVDRSALSAEQQSGIDTFLAPYLPLSAADAERLRQSVDFLLDCLYSDDATMRKLALSRLAAISGSDLPKDLSADSDARIGQIEQLRERLAPAATAATAPTR